MFSMILRCVCFSSGIEFTYLKIQPGQLTCQPEVELHRRILAISQSTSNKNIASDGFLTPHFCLVEQPMQTALAADRIDRWAGSCVTSCDGHTVYGATSLRDFLVDVVQTKGVSSTVAKTDVRNALKQVTWTWNLYETECGAGCRFSYMSSFGRGLVFEWWLYLYWFNG